MKIHTLLIVFFGALPACVLGQETSGIGIAIGQEGGHVIVNAILPGSVAASTPGIRVGDRILAISQGSEAAESVEGLKIAEIAKKIRGPKGTTVRLTLASRDEGEEQARVVSFVRGEVRELARWGDGVLLPEGSEAPDIPLTPLSAGQGEKLSQFRGKIVVIKFWATWCGPCQKPMAELQTY